MRWYLSTPGSAEYILPITLSTSVTPVSPYTRHCSLKMYLEAVIEWVWRFTWRPWSWELRGHNRASLVIHMEAVIERVWRCTWRLWLSEYRDTLGGCDRARVEMHLEAMIKGDWRSTCGRSIWRRYSSVGRRDGSCDSIHWLTRNCRNVVNWVQHGLPSDERLAGSGRQSILGWCSMRFMEYSVYAVFGVCCTGCMLVLGVCLYSVYACTRCMLVLGVCLYMVYTVLGVNSWSSHWEIARDDLTWCS